MTFGSCFGHYEVDYDNENQHTTYSRRSSIYTTWNKPLYNEVLGTCLTNDFPYPSNSKLYDKEPRHNETLLQQKANFASPLALSLEKIDVGHSWELDQCIHQDNKVTIIFKILSLNVRLCIAQSTHPPGQPSLDSASQPIGIT